MRTIALLFLALSLLSFPFPADAQGRMGYRGMGYGDFCPGMGMGPYGARRAIRTADDARRAITNYFAGTDQAVHPGKIVEKDLYFTVELLDRNNTVVDTAIVDKRTGRVRSIY